MIVGTAVMRLERTVLKNAIQTTMITRTLYATMAMSPTQIMFVMVIMTAVTVQMNLQTCVMYPAYQDCGTMMTFCVVMEAVYAPAGCVMGTMIVEIAVMKLGKDVRQAATPTLNMYTTLKNQTLYVTMES